MKTKKLRLFDVMVRTESSPTKKHPVAISRMYLTVYAKSQKAAERMAESIVEEMGVTLTKHDLVDAREL